MFDFKDLRNTTRDFIMKINGDEYIIKNKDGKYAIHRESTGTYISSWNYEYMEERVEKTIYTYFVRFIKINNLKGW